MLKQRSSLPRRGRCDRPEFLREEPACGCAVVAAEIVTRCEQIPGPVEPLGVFVNHSLKKSGDLPAMPVRCSTSRRRIA